MKPARLYRWLAFSFAVCMTSSIMVFTVNAAAAQENLPAPPAGVVIDPLAPAGAPVAPAPVPIPVPIPVPADGNVDDQLLPPDEVLHNRKHEIVLDPSGSFSGQLSAATDVDGNLVPAIGLTVRVIRAGVVTATATTDATGTFSVTGLSEGVVAILAYNDSHLLLNSVRLVASPNVFAEEQAASEAATPVKLIAEAANLALRSTVVSARDVATVKQLIFSELPVRELRFNGEPTDVERTYPFGTQQKSTSVDYHPVQLQPDGTLRGQVNLMDERTGRHREVMDLMLHFVRNGQHVGATKVQTNGRFEIAGLIPGVYAIATTGTDGVFATGQEIVASANDVVAKESKFKLTSVAQQLNLAVSPANAKNFNSNNVQQHNGLTSPSGAGGAGGAPVAGGAPMGGPAGGPMGGAPGGLGGGLGGGGAGVGGGGGLGALLAGAAAGALGYALGQENNDTPASPAR